MEYLASAERGKLKVKTLHCCWGIWIADLRGSKEVRAAVGSVTWSLAPSCVFSIAIPAAKHQGHCGTVLLEMWKLESSGVHTSQAVMCKGLQGALRVSRIGHSCSVRDLSWTCSIKVEFQPHAERAWRTGWLRRMISSLYLDALSHLRVVYESIYLVVCILKWMQVNVTVCYIDPSRLNRWTLQEWTASSRKQGCCGTWCSLVFVSSQ